MKKIVFNGLLLLSFATTSSAYAAEEPVVEELERVKVHAKMRIPGTNVELDEHDLDQFNLIMKKAGMYALAGIAQRQILRHNDPSESISEKLRGGLTDFLIGAAITEITPLAIGFAFKNLHKAFLHLPIDYCRKKKLEFEHTQSMHNLKIHEALQGDTKNKLQEALLKDAKLLKQCENQLEKIKEEIEVESDETKKNSLKEIYNNLKEQRTQASVNFTMLSFMSISDFQPFQTSVILESMRARKEAAQARS